MTDTKHQGAGDANAFNVNPSSTGLQKFSIKSMSLSA